MEGDENVSRKNKGSDNAYLRTRARNSIRVKYSDLVPKQEKVSDAKLALFARFKLLKESRAV